MGPAVERADVDLTLLAGDGATAPVVASLAIESNESGERTCCRVVLVDVRRRRDAERAVEQRGQQLQDFLDHSGDLIQSVDDEGRIVEFEVMIRPFNALQALGAEMGARLAQQLPAFKIGG